MKIRPMLAGSIAVLSLTAACSDDSSTRADPQTSEGGDTGSPSTSSSASTATTAPSDTGQDTGADPATVSISIGEPSAIDPALAQELEGAQVMRLLVETLVSLDADLTVVPGVAERWSVADDGVTWTFELADDAVFSDGRPVVAGDFAFAFARAADPDLAAPASYQGLPILGWAEVNEAEPSGAIGDVPVAGLVAVDDHTLTIETIEPFTLLPKVLTYQIFAPVAPEYVDTVDEAAAYAEQPIGNGPYMLDGAWDHQVGIDLVKNPLFHGEQGKADRIEFQIFESSATAYREFEAGNLDIARSLAPENIADARSTNGDRFIQTQTGSLLYIGLPTTLAPYDDLDLRKALSLAIDREVIAERIFEGTQTPATGLVPTQVPGAVTGGCDACTYDPELAQELYESSGGFPDDTMVLYDISDDGQEMLEPIINSWRELFGVEVEIRSYEFAQYLEETATDRVEGAFELGWVWDYPSGYSFLSPLLESTSFANNLGWANTEFDSLLAEVREAADEEAGLAPLGSAQQIAEAEMPLIPLVFTNDIGVHSERLSNVFVDAGGLWRVELIDVAPSGA